jgi:predicted ATP-dependent endonuclease of OLD family
VKINKIEIKNYRSIQNITLEFNPSCKILVGINESGKTNILKALSFLKPDVQPIKTDDLREALPDEDLINESYVRFVFGFDKKDINHLVSNSRNKILFKKNNEPLLIANNKNYNLEEVFCSVYDESIYSVNILDEKKTFQYWKKSATLASNWKKPSQVCPSEFSVTSGKEAFIIKNYSLVNINDFSEIPVEYLEDSNFSEVSALIGAQITTLTEKNVPECLYWNYNEDNLLPGMIDIDAFSNNPDLCLPLKNMFLLSGIDDIKASILEARKRGNNQFQNYLDGIAKKTTTHFRDVWKEYKNIEFSLRLNANNIEPGIKEKNTLDFKKRSDGFKRFTTFLLMISVNVKTDNIKNTLLLIDEPEIGLHPSGARYLREELIKISKTNYVVYSTHSIFMIDSGDISRHYIVNKKNEITTVQVAKDSNIADEEVIFNALGYSIFETLKDKNIIFEGWKDKKLFYTAVESANILQKKFFKDIGVCHAKGVKHIKTITPLMELANRDCLILSDSDALAKEQQKQYIDSGGHGVWKTYQDVNANLEAVTGEDFILDTHIVKQVNKVLTDLNLPVFKEEDIATNKNKLHKIENWLKVNNIQKNQIDALIFEIKNLIFENLTHKSIDANYTIFLNSIFEHLKPSE